MTSRPRRVAPSWWARMDEPDRVWVRQLIMMMLIGLIVIAGLSATLILSEPRVVRVDVPKPGPTVTVTATPTPAPSATAATPTPTRRP